MDLDVKCIKLLQCLKNENDILNLSQISVLTHFSNDDILERLVFLWKNKYISVVAFEQPELLPMNGQFQITTQGKIHLEIINKKKKSQILEWVRYEITTLIAVAALINSIWARLER